MVEVLESPSIFFAGHGRQPRCRSRWRTAKAFADFAQRGDAAQGRSRAMRFVDNHGQPTERYPFNPNGSPAA